MYTKSPWVLVEISYHYSFGHSERSDLREKTGGSTIWTHELHLLQLQKTWESEKLQSQLTNRCKGLQETDCFMCKTSKNHPTNYITSKGCFVYCTSDHPNGISNERQNIWIHVLASCWNAIFFFWRVVVKHSESSHIDFLLAWTFMNILPR